MPATGIATLPSDLRSRLLDGMAPGEVEVILAAATKRCYLANSVITNQGNPSKHLFLLTSGHARYFYITQDGQKTLLLCLTPRDILAGPPFLARPLNYLSTHKAAK